MVVSPGAGANLIFVDAASIAVADSGIELDVSDEALVQMDDAPAPATASDDLCESLAGEQDRDPRRAVFELEGGDRQCAVHDDVNVTTPGTCGAREPHAETG